jgi:DNA-directed RNA polymerase specialized sigma24 family protein
MPASDDLVLITAYLAGDAGAFDILFQSYHARVREEAMLKVADRDRSGHPEDALEMSSLRQLVWDVAKKLPERQRMVLTLRELQGLSYASIARFMGTTEAAVETLLHRARKRHLESCALCRDAYESAAVGAGSRQAVVPA